MDVIALTKKLVSIPSFVQGPVHNEEKLGRFLFNFLKQFNFLRVKKQKVEGRRFNVIAETKGKPRILFAVHMDTVEPKQGWTKPLFGGKITGDKLYGLGAFDTKGGMAALLAALKDIKIVSGATFLFYCDEEYDFKGMRTFLKEVKKPPYKLALVIEPSELKIWNAHRGLIEIAFSINGKSGHAANPHSGRSANTALINVLKRLEDSFKRFHHPFLGYSSLNIAYMRGGLYRGDKNGEVILGKQGNNIPDYAEAIIDIRSISKEINAEKIQAFLIKEFKKESVVCDSFKIRHNFGSLYTSPQALKPVANALQKSNVPVKFLNPIAKGYGDGQLIQEKWKIPVAYLGPAGGGAHSVDEFVSMRSLRTLKLIYKNLLIDITTNLF